MTHLRTLASLFGLLLVAGCSDQSGDAGAPESTPFVETTAVEASDSRRLSLTGEVRPRYETPLAFQIEGRIERRHVESGDRVEAGERLFHLDEKDLRENLQAAIAEREVAESTLALASSDLERDRRLLRDQHISQQTVDRTELREREARSQLNAAEARVELARNALDYAELRAPADGVITRVTGEPGQVVGPGQGVGMLAHDGRRELVFDFPEEVQPPQTGTARSADGEAIALSRREVAGELEPRSRTRRVRYQLDESLDDAVPGTIIRATFDLGGAEGWQVPVTALDERTDGAFVWRIDDDGQAQPLPVEVVEVTPDRARVLGDLHGETEVIRIGTHLLEPGMAVQERAQ